MLNMMADLSLIEGCFAVLGMLGALMLGIANVALATPPETIPVEKVKDRHPAGIYDLWRI